MFKLKDDVLFQKDYRIDEDVSIAKFVANPNSDDICPEDAIAVIAVNGIPYELNLSAAIIVEEIMLCKTISQISEILEKLFNISNSKANSVIQSCIENLIKLDVIEKI